MSGLPGYDDWKTREPDHGPEMQTDPGPCDLCKASGVIVTNRHGRYIGAGPLPDPAPRGFWESDCPSCGGGGEIPEPETHQ